MEQNKELIFEVICDEEDTMLNAIELYNRTYKTNFRLLEYILDEVNFAKISGNVKVSDVFQLGTLYCRLSNPDRADL